MFKKKFLKELIVLPIKMLRTPLIMITGTYCAVYIYSILWGSIVGDWTPFANNQDCLETIIKCFV
jgi:hypothetical protein